MGETSAPGSLTVWDRVTRDPQDQQAWQQFLGRYWSVVFGWVRNYQVRGQDAEDITLEVFERLFFRITNPEREPVRPHNDSFRSFICSVVRNLIRDSRGRERARTVGLSEETLARLEDPQSLQDLADQIGAREELDRSLVRCAEFYPLAVRRLRAGPQFHPESFETFLRYYRDGHNPAQIAIEFGVTPVTARRTAKRVWDRLLALMQAQDGTIPAAMMECILGELVRIHEDLSD